MDDQALLTLTNPPAELSPELRKELMDLATSLRSAAAKIDVLCVRKPKKEVDASGQPTFAFDARVTIPADFFITSRLYQYAAVKGFKDKEIKDMADEFIRYYNKTGRKWQDWSRVWFTWVTREAAQKAATPTRVTSDRMKTW